MLKTWAARHWAAHGTGPHGTGPHGTGPHGTGPKFFRDGAASGPSCHTPPCYLLRGTAALAPDHASGSSAAGLLLLLALLVLPQWTYQAWY
jgi:hypothetical protein